MSDMKSRPRGNDGFVGWGESQANPNACDVAALGFALLTPTYANLKSQNVTSNASRRIGFTKD